MENQIWKYAITPDKLSHEIPKNGVIRHIDVQYDDICLWVEVNPIKLKETRHFEIFGTGHPIQHDLGIERTYLGSVKLKCGAFVFHIYERIA